MQRIASVQHTLDGRYATAFFNAAARSNVLDAAESDVSKLKTQCLNQKFKMFLETPLPKVQKMSILDKISSSLKLSPQSTQLLKVMADNGRLSLLPQVTDSFSMLMRLHKNKVLIMVTSARPLDQKTLQVLETNLKNSKLVNKAPVEIQNKVNPAILGGLIVEVGNHTIDLSAALKVAQITKCFTE